MEPVPKARTRGSTACAACRTRRTRCDPQNGTSCNRCRQFGIVCSFSQRSSQSEGLNGYVNLGTTGQLDPGGQNAMLQRIAQLESRLLAFDTRQPVSAPVDAFPMTLPSISPQSDQISLARPFIGASSSVTQDAKMEDPRETGDVGRKQRVTTNTSWMRPWSLPDRYGLMHKGWYGSETEALWDPIAEGVLTPKEAEAAYQM